MVQSEVSNSSDRLSSPMSSTISLLRLLQIGEITLRNRIVMSPLTRSRSVPTNVPNNLNTEYYARQARGGAGLIISEGTLISRQGWVLPRGNCSEQD